MNIKKLKVYAALSALPLLEKSYVFRKSYVFKVLMISGVGIIIPLIISSFYFVSVYSSLNFSPIFGILLLTTLISLISTVILLDKFLYPIVLTSKVLHQYLNNEQQIDTLPKNFEDHAGQLMMDVQYIIDKLDLVIQSVDSCSNLDPLTGIPNRRAGIELLRQDMARARREENQMLVALLDVDKLKEINDEFGHHVGDVCLTQLVEVISKSVREGDWIARWSGDKFLMVLWNFNHAMPTTVLERIQRQFSRTPMGDLLQMSFSIGACEYRGDNELYTETDLETLLIELDETLSTIKQEGRGGIMLAKN